MGSLNMQEKDAELFCTTPDGLEFIVRDEIERALSFDSEIFGGFRESAVPGVVRFTLRKPLQRPPVAREAILRIHKLRSIGQVCGEIFESDAEYPLTSTDELAKLQEATRNPNVAPQWVMALVLWSAVQGPTCVPATRDGKFPETLEDICAALADKVLFRCTCRRHGKGLRDQKPKWKSPDAERKIGGVVYEMFGWKASMHLYTLQVLGVLNADRVALGIPLQPPNPFRPGYDFHTKSKTERDKEGKAELVKAARERLAGQAALEEQGCAFRAKLLAGENIDMEGKEGEAFKRLKASDDKHEVRAGLSENSMITAIAHALVVLADPKPGDVFIDPMVGSGTVLLEACLHEPRAIVLGGDITPSEASTASLNADFFPSMATKFGLWPSPSTSPKAKRPRTTEGQAETSLPYPGVAGVFCWSACQLPFKSASVDAIASDLPFGNRCGSKNKNSKLYPPLMKEFLRVLRVGGRCVVLTVQNKLMQAVLAEKPLCDGFKLTREPFRVNMGEMMPRMFVLEKVADPSP